MVDIDRRSALAFGIAAASGVAAPGLAAARMSGMSGPGGTAAPEGREIAPGVRIFDYSKRGSAIPAYKNVVMRDFVYQPGAKTINPSMPNEMVCHMLEGELSVNHGPGMDFVVKKNAVWSCAKGQPENGHNTGSTVAIMRVIDLLA